jgi:hypothetical protein
LCQDPKKERRGKSGCDHSRTRRLERLEIF